MTEVYLVRHGEAEGNVFRRLHGQYDSLLTPQGERQVECVRRRFENIHIDGCFASDLTRASLTARSIYVPKGLVLRRSPVFREVNVGIWEDVPYGLLHREDPEQMHNFNHAPKIWRVTGAETYQQYTQRMIDGICRAAEEFPGGTIAIFSHGAAIRSSLLRLFYGGNAEGFPYSDNTGVSKLIYDRGELKAEFLNDCSHLPEELATYTKQKWWREHGGRKRANMYYLPLSQVHDLPKELVPEREGFTLIAMLEEEPAGQVTLGDFQEEVGQLLEMKLLPGLENRGYADQLLGCAFSHFRKFGCKALAAEPGQYPDDVLNRYGFDPNTLRRSISTASFDWSGTEFWT